MIEVQPKSTIDATVSIPGSKSVTHRALIASGLAGGESLLEAFLECEDTMHTLNALRDLGVDISIENENVRVVGVGGHFPPSSGLKEIFLGNAGTSYRLLLSIVALARGEYLMKGIPRMHERPVGDLIRALKGLGVKALCTEREDYPPVSISAAGIRGGKVKISGEKSSQYISSLLLAGPYTEEGMEIEVTGNLVSRPYLDVTLDVMRSFGVSVERDGYRHFKVPAGQGYLPCRFRIDGDVSTASYFWGAAAVTGGTVVTDNIHPGTTRQGDIALLEILEEM